MIFIWTDPWWSSNLHVDLCKDICWGLWKVLVIISRILNFFSKLQTCQLGRTRNLEFFSIWRLIDQWTNQLVKPGAYIKRSVEFRKRSTQFIDFMVTVSIVSINKLGIIFKYRWFCWKISNYFPWHLKSESQKQKGLTMIPCHYLQVKGAGNGLSLTLPISLLVEWRFILIPTSWSEDLRKMVC